MKILGLRVPFASKFQESSILHSCGPSTDYFLNRDSGEVEIRATSKILKGQEITFSYFTLNEAPNCFITDHGGRKTRKAKVMELIEVRITIKKIF